MSTYNHFNKTALTISILLMVLCFAWVDSVDAQGLHDEIKPACTVNSTFWDRFFDRCTEVNPSVVSNQPKLVDINTQAWIDAINTATMDWVNAHRGQPNQFVDGNWVNKRAAELYCLTYNQAGDLDVTGKPICK